MFLFEDTANPATKYTVNASLVYLAGVTANTRIEVPHSMGPWEAHLGASKGGDLILAIRLEPSDPSLNWAQAQIGRFLQS